MTKLLLQTSQRPKVGTSESTRPECSDPHQTNFSNIGYKLPGRAKQLAPWRAKETVIQRKSIKKILKLKLNHVKTVGPPIVNG